MKCKECYSENPRITPLKGAEDCLTKHMQYICSTCGRCICIDLKGSKKARSFMPFSSLELAKLYLKAAEIMNDGICGIYELIYKRGEKRYRVFKSVEELKKQLKINKNIRCENFEPVYISDKHTPVSDTQIRHLNSKEIKKYLEERKEMDIK